MFEEKVDGEVVGLAVCDYRLDGNSTLIAVTKSGGVRGWLPSSSGQTLQQQAVAGEVSSFGTLEKGKDDNTAYQKLNNKRNDLQQELKAIQHQLQEFKKNSSGKPRSSVSNLNGKPEVVQGVIPTDTRLDVSLKVGLKILLFFYVSDEI